jgi:outer membrane murein-binding lipoprotein Lpp
MIRSQRWQLPPVTERRDTQLVSTDHQCALPTCCCCRRGCPQAALDKLADERSRTQARLEELEDEAPALRQQAKAALARAAESDSRHMQAQRLLDSMQHDCLSLRCPPPLLRRACFRTQRWHALDGVGRTGGDVLRRHVVHMHLLKGECVSSR